VIVPSLPSSCLSDAMQVHIGEDGTTFEESEDRVFVAPTSIALQAQLTDVELQSALDRIGMLCSNDPLYELNYDERALFWKARRHLMATPEALPWFLQSVSWDDVACVSEARKLMSKWEKPSPMLALQLLDIKFPDPSVRAYAVSCLEELDNKSLRQIMLQLTQVLKFEPFQDSALSRFLLRRAVRNPRDVGHVFFWLLQAEMHMKEVSERYGAMLEQYLRNCGDYRTELGHQMFVMSRLEQTAYKVKTGGSKEERLSILSQELQSIVFPREFQLPLSPDMVASGLVLSPMKCRVMSSKKLPLWLVFKSVRDPGTTHTVLFKAGDDLRQDQLTLQILNIMDNLWKERGLDLRMSPYMSVPYPPPSFSHDSPLCALRQCCCVSHLFFPGVCPLGMSWACCKWC
jgi:Phosphoinositide 3-kinase family, accessory domain (PIK domain)/Phosphatidylinositol 3- and 4-kinase